MRNYFLMALIFTVGVVRANNISVSNVTLAGQNVSAGVNNAANFTYIEFDLTWENSWRTSSAPNNWDAAWVFVKYRTTGSSAWNHVKLAPSGHNTSPTSPTTSYSVQVGLVDESAVHNATTNPAVGAFIYRSGNGTGTFSANDIRLKWFYRDNGVGDNDIIDVEVYAIEMVYVPDGSFWLGDNGVSGTSTSFPQYQLYANGVSGQGYNITTEASLQFCIPGGGCGGGQLFVQDAANAGTTLSASFPKGYKGFYAMKYEASQQHYVDFLNTLTSAQQSAVGFTYTTNRINISVSSSVYSTTTPYVPIGNIKSSDFLAYLDWAGLRPMTEMEFEKACRGTATPVTGEYAWGNTNIVNHINTFNNSGAASETPALSTANANLAASDPVNCTACGPIRCGAFANSSSTRASSGSSTYGIMELSGNMMEIVVRLTGPVFTGLHGDGIITTAGAADVANWNTSTYNARGGSFSTRNCATQFNTVADRHQFAVTSRSVDYGIRGVHTKPITASETK